MSTKKATKMTNVVATLYESTFEITFDCVGTMVCQFAMCSEMPIDGKEECFFRGHGSCRRPAAQHTALEILHNRIKKELKRYKEEG